MIVTTTAWIYSCCPLTKVRALDWYPLQKNSRCSRTHILVICPCICIWFVLVSGITGYRDDSLDTVKRNKEQYGMPLLILSYKDLYNWTMDEIVSHIGLKGNCTFCGVFRRQALDRGAAKLKADKVVTGHNADDMAETVLLNCKCLPVISSRLYEMLRCGVHFFTSSHCSVMTIIRVSRYLCVDVVRHAHTCTTPILSQC
jgi:hypothetical protein